MPGTTTPIQAEATPRTPQTGSGERWYFQVHSPRSERVFLVQQSPELGSIWHEMAHFGAGQWGLEHHVAPGHNRFHYFTSEAGTYINCGTEGLTGSRLSQADPDVLIQPMFLDETDATEQKLSA